MAKSAVRKDRSTPKRGVAKVSVTIPAGDVAQIQALVGPRGFSAFVSDAVRVRLQRYRIEKLLAELDDEYGAVPPDVQREVDRKWRRLTR